jgi:NADH-quinone oxidoreductase subunit M
LNKAIPFATVTFVIAGVASMGLPGFSGFVAELQVLIGAWRGYPTLTVVAGIGILIGVAYTLRAVQKAFFGDAPLTPALSPSDGARESTLAGAHNPHRVEAISVPERFGAVLLIGTSLLIGLYPRLLLDVIVPSFNSPLFDGLRKVFGL